MIKNARITEESRRTPNEEQELGTITYYISIFWIVAL
jgi:hypothetical protein